MSGFDDVLVADITQGVLFKSAAIGFRTYDGSAVAAADVQARCDFARSPGGAVIASMATADDDTADGTIEVVQVADDEVGLIHRLPSDVTAGLTPIYDEFGTVELAGVGFTKVRVVGSEDDEWQPGRRWHVRIFPEVAE